MSASTDTVDLPRLKPGRYMLRVVVADMAAYDDFYRRLTDAVPIKNLTSHFVMERIKFTTAYPVDTRNR